MEIYDENWKQENRKKKESFKMYFYSTENCRRKKNIITMAIIIFGILKIFTNYNNKTKNI